MAFDEMRRVRDLISGHPLQNGLMLNRDSWGRLCTGLDKIDDSGTPAGALKALNAVRAELQMDEVHVAAREDISAAVQAGVVAVRTELEDRVRVHEAKFSGRLADLVPETLMYSVEKTSEALAHGGAYNRVMGIDALQQSFSDLAAALMARGFEEHVRAEVEDALYIVQRAAAVSEGSASGGQAKDVGLLVRYALRPLVKSIRELAAELDESHSQGPAGWSTGSD